jgi:glucose dehydrogenase
MPTPTYQYHAGGQRHTAASNVQRVRPESVCILAVGFVLFFGASNAFASPKGIAADSSGGDWVYVDHDLGGTRYSPLKQITTKNVSRLVKACSYSFPEKGPSQTAPIVSAGRMYLTTARYTVALDGADCHVIWSSTWTPHASTWLTTHRGARRRQDHSRYQ